MNTSIIVIYTLYIYISYIHAYLNNCSISVSALSSLLYINIAIDKLNARTIFSWGESWAALSKLGIST